jgi:hypothetical protein
MQVAWLNREGQAWTHGDTRPHLEVRDLHALCASWPEYVLQVSGFSPDIGLCDAKIRRQR